MEKLNVAPYSMKNKGIRLKNSDWKDDVRKKVNEFKPDLIAISSTEDMWELGIRILNEVKDYKKKIKLLSLQGEYFQLLHLIFA